MTVFVEKIWKLKELALKQKNITEEEARELIVLITFLFRGLCLDYWYDARQILRVQTKLRDAGRRSPPWKPASSRVPGRPQDWLDWNRILRWKLDPEHKFFADEINATLTEVKYYLQLLSMKDSPLLPENSIQKDFYWLIEHDILPWLYLDPIQLIPISLKDIMNDARIIQSGHLHPLDRWWKHEPKNAFLMLYRSNQIQGNLTVKELVQLMTEIVERHKKYGSNQ